MIRVQLKRSKNTRVVTKLKQALDRIENCNVTVGIHPEAGSYPSTGAKDAPTVAQVAEWMEKGTKRDGNSVVPARSFLQSTADENKALLQRLMDRAVINVGWNGWTVQRALGRIGSQFLRAVQNKVKSNVAPDLSEAYKARKLKKGQPERTLIRTGKLLGSLTYKVNLDRKAQREADAAAKAAPPASSGTKSGTPDSRAGARTDAAAIRDRAKKQREAFKTDKNKQAKFAAQQATKGK